ncbi:hypothetical protein PY650_24375, partial [Rhizobium calliandrae]
GHELQVKICWSSCSYRLHFLTSWSLRQTRRGSNDKTHTPVFTLCYEVGAEDVAGVPTFHYIANWSRHSWKASIDIWIDQTTGKFIKTISHYEPGYGEFYFPVALRAFDYDPDHASKPDVSN